MKRRGISQYDACELNRKWKELVRKEAVERQKLKDAARKSTESENLNNSTEQLPTQV
jgi:hypothetical protein